MCKSSVLAFVLIFAFIFKLEKPSWKLAGIISLMTLGVFLMVAGETEFKLGGFLLIMTASASSGLRWSLTQILLIRHPATSNPFSSIFFLAPVMFVTLFLLALPVEGLVDLFHAYQKLANLHGSLLAPLILLFPGCLAFLMTASEFALLQRTSVVTLSIGGIFKEVLTISVAYLVFGDQLTPINGVGLVITIATIAGYNYFKITKLREAARQEVHESLAAGGADYAPVSSSDPDVEDAKIVPKRPYADSISHERPCVIHERPEGILRKDLSVSTASSRAPNDSSRASPVKRPEDLE
jgi:solute carrier family 35 protein C2